ncbi:MAG: M16 family metallopeptidase [Bdellovibrionia bacterium]
MKPWVLTLLGYLCFLSATLGHALEVDFEKNSNLPLVYLNVVLNHGSVKDPQGQMGLTNFMGEMLLRGTRSKNKAQIDQALDQWGAKLEVETRAEALIFRGAVLSSQLNPFLSLLRELLTEPSFPQLEIDKLKAEIIAGIQEEKGHDSSLATRSFTQFLFQDHPYGRSVLGRTPDIESMTREQVLAHHRALLKEDSLFILGSGDSPVEPIQAWAKTLGESLQKLLSTPTPQTPNTTASLGLTTPLGRPENAQTRRLLIIDKPDRTQTQIHIGQIGVKMTDPDFFSLYLGNHAFGGPSFSSTLMEEIRVKRGWSYGVSSQFRHGTEPRSWIVHLYPAQADAAAALKHSLQLISQLKEHGLTPQQFEFAQQSLIQSSGFTYNTPKKRVENKILEKTLKLPTGFMQSFASELRKLTLPQVNQALNHFLKPDQLAISVLATSKKLRAALIQASGVQPKEVKEVLFSKE